MRVICVDDEEQTLRSTVALCGEAPQVTEVTGFTGAREALAWLGEHPADLAILGVGLPGTDGIALARAIRGLGGETAILILAADERHAVEAWEVHATGYVLKPLTAERLADELNYAAVWMRERTGKAPVPHISVQSFGNFDLLVDGKRVYFSRARAKELLAFLVDRKGIRITRREAFQILWPGEEYTRPMQKQLDVIIRSLRETLREYGIDRILKMERGTLRILPRALDCDMYRLFAGDEHYENAYQGEYMNSYAWANMTEGQIDSELRRRALRRRGAPDE